MHTGTPRRVPSTRIISLMGTVMVSPEKLKSIVFWLFM